MNWAVVISAVGVLIAGIAFLRTEEWRRKTVTTEKERELEDKIGKATAMAAKVDSELGRIRERIKHMPSQSQIAGLRQSVSDLAAEVKGLHTGLDAQSRALGVVSKTVGRIEDYLLNQSGPKQ